ncbi:Cullin-3, partial [Irineochytrium annulatum]
MASLRKKSSTGSTSSSKIIRPIKKNTSEFGDAWNKLCNSIQEIYRKNASTLSFEELYRNAYNMVLHKHGEKLYNGVHAVIKEHLDEVAVTGIVPTFPVSQTVLSTTSSAASSGEHSSLPKSGSFVGGQQYLKVLRDAWNEHVTCMIMIRDILLYMVKIEFCARVCSLGIADGMSQTKDRVYVKASGKTAIFDMGLEIFRDVVLRSNRYPIGSKAIETVLEQIKMDREGETVDRGTVKGIIEMMLQLEMNNPIKRCSSTVYEMDFEPDFMRESEAFYTLEAAELLRTCDATEFLKRVEVRLTEEDNRGRYFLAPSTQQQLIPKLEDVMLARTVSAVLDMENSGLVPMLEHDRINDLSRAYRLLARVKAIGHAEMRKTMKSFIEQCGKSINESFGGMAARGGGASVAAPKAGSSNDADASAASVVQAANPQKWMEALLELRAKYDLILEQAFGKDRAFVNDVNSGLETIINENPKGPEFISLFIDDNLKKGVKGKSEAEIDALLDKTISLFRLIKEKDVFERYYKQHLAKRLLFQRSANEDAEKSMISKLKLECGSSFTQKLEGMFTDMRISVDIMAGFRSRNVAGDESKDGSEISVNVLTATYWPVSTITATTALQYPDVIHRAMDRFHKYYLNRHSGRRLTWLGHMGSADLKAHFPKGRKELNVSTYAMCVLVGVFNDVPEGEGVSFEKIKDVTGIPVPELKRTLQSLSVAKYKILAKSSKGRDVLNNDMFTVNAGFTSPLNKIKIQTIVGNGGG